MAPIISFLEPLEDRIAPASLLNAKTVEYKDLDGDIVHVQVTKGALDLAMFTFVDSGVDGAQILNSLNLTDPQFAGANLTISTLKIKNGPGNGLVDVGAILAAGNDLGMVKITGGLEKITAGDSATFQKGITSLTVDSLGMFSTDNASLVTGKIGKLSVTHDVEGSLGVAGGVLAGIGSVNVGGSLIAKAGGTNEGWIHATGSVGTVIIKGGIDGTHADGASEAGISSDGKMGNVTIGSDILGGGFTNAGSVHSGLTMGMVTIGGDVKGAAGDGSGEIFAGGNIGSVSIAGSLIGNSGNASGSIVSGGKMGNVTIGHDMTGGTHAGSGSILATGTIGNISIGDLENHTSGNLTGGAFDSTGLIRSSNGSIGNVTIALAVTGGSSTNSGTIMAAQNIGNVSIGGPVTGPVFAHDALIGGGDNSGSIWAINGKIGNITLNGDVKGGAGLISGMVSSNSGMGSVTIHGSLIGGTGDDSGSIQTSSAEHSPSPTTGSGNIGVVLISGDVEGSSGLRTGSVIAWNGTMTSLAVNGSITGGGGQFSAMMYGRNGLGSATVGHDVIGGTGSYSGRIATEVNVLLSKVVYEGATKLLPHGDGNTTTYLNYKDGVMGDVNIGGKLQGGDGDNSGTIFSGKSIGAVVIQGSVTGGTGDNSGSISIGRNNTQNAIDSPTPNLVNTNFYLGTAADKIASVLVGENLVGGTGSGSGSIFTAMNYQAPKNGNDPVGTGGALGNITVNGFVQGGGGSNSGAIYAGNNIGNIAIGGPVTGTALPGGALIGGGADNSGSIWAINGKIGNITLNGDVKGGAGLISGMVSSNSGMGSVTIHGSLIGGTGDDSGSIQTSSAEHSPSPITGSGNMGAVLITGDVEGNSGLRTGSVIAWNGTMTSLAVNGSITGGGGQYSAMMYGRDGLGSATVGHDVIGGTGPYSGRIATEVNVSLSKVVYEGATKLLPHGDGNTTTYLNYKDGVMGDVNIGGKLQGGDGDNSGTIFSGKSMGTVHINGSVTGGVGGSSGSISIGRDNTQNAIGDPSLGLINTNFYLGTAADKIAGVIIGGNLVGGTGSESGSIFTAMNYKAVTNGYVVTGGALGAITVNGFVQGGDGANSGTIYAGKSMGAVLISGTMPGGAGLNGGAGASSGSISISANEQGLLVSATDKVTSVTVNGILGGSGSGSGNVEINGTLGSLSVFGNIHGGSNQFTGRVYAASITTANVTGSLIGTDYTYAGSIIGNNSIGSLVITGDMIGGSNSHGSDVIGTGAVLAGQIGSVTVTGDITSGTPADSGHLLYDSAAIRSASNIGSVTVGGSIEGNQAMPVYITASTDFGGFINVNKVIGTVSVTHNVTHALILAGVDLGSFDQPGKPSVEYSGVNPFAQITSVTVGGNWAASSVAAGALPGTHGFGAGDTPSLDKVVGGTPPTWYGDFGRIGSITITGTVAGGNSGDQYGFVAANFGSVSVNSQTVTVPGHTGASTVADSGSSTNIQGSGVIIHRLPWIAETVV